MRPNSIQSQRPLRQYSASPSRSNTSRASTSSAQHIGHQFLKNAADGLLFLAQLCCSTKPTLQQTLDKWLASLPEEEQQAGNQFCISVQQKTAQDSTMQIIWKQASALPDLSPFFKNTKTLDIVSWSGDIPEWIGHFPKLEKLTTTAEFWDRLPNSLEKLSNLRKLKLKDCKFLRNLPDSMPKLVNLRSISLIHCNQLSLLPENLGELHLKDLNIRHCRTLARLPSTLGQLSQLEELNATQCPQLTSLPANLLELPSSCHIDFEGSGLSPALANALQQRIREREQQGLSVPNIRFSLNAGNHDLRQVGTLESQLQAWRAEGGIETPQTQDETNAINQLSELENKALATLLHLLKYTAIYRSQQEATVERVNHLLNQALKNPDMLGLYCAMALESTETCDDRTALGLMHMERIALEHDLLTQAKQAASPQQAYALLKQQAPGIFKLQKLLEIAHQHALVAPGAVDETEMVLRYLTALGQEFKLPVRIDHMKFSEFGWQVDQKALDKARTQLNNLTDAQLVDLWAQWPVYHDVLEHHEPTVYQSLQEEQHSIREDFAQQALELTSALEEASEKFGVYSEKTINITININKLKNTQNQAITEPWRKRVADSLKN